MPRNIHANIYYIIKIKINSKQKLISIRRKGHVMIHVNFPWLIDFGSDPKNKIELILIKYK